MSVFAIFGLIFGGMTLVVGLLLIFRNQEFCKIIDDLVSSPSQLFEWGLMSLVLGLVVLGNEYRLNLGEWYWVIPALGWLSVIKGVWIMLLPNTFKGMARTYCPPGSKTAFYGIVSLLVGGSLLWLAFSVY